MSNKIIAMFNMDEVKKSIEKCPADEVVILCGHWSINGPKPLEGEDPESIDWDFQEFEDALGVTVMVSDYDDLIADPHGIMNS